jgi:membrane protease YdiL (CAAX protease family)
VSVLLAALWALWLLRSRAASGLLPHQRRRFIPWTGQQLAAVVLLILLVWPSLVEWALTQSGLLSRLYGPDFLPALQSKDPQLHKQALVRLVTWREVVSWPLKMATLLALLPLNGAHLYQLGLSGRRLGRNVIVGVCTWCALTPLVISLNDVLEGLWKAWVTVPTPHPLTELSQAHPLPIDWILLAGSALVLAPLLEELLFRGVLQPWFASHPRGGDVAMLASLGLAAMVTSPAVGEAWKQGSWRDGLIALAPVLFVLAMVPGYQVLVSALRWRTAGAIYATGLLFGIAHASVWPTPVSLFLLGVGLGIVAYRTQSIIPSVVCHALFNSVGLVLLLLPQVAPKPDKGKDATPACLVAPAVSTSSAVPGSE